MHPQAPVALQQVVCNNTGMQGRQPVHVLPELLPLLPELLPELLLLLLLLPPELLLLLLELATLPELLPLPEPPLLLAELPPPPLDPPSTLPVPSPGAWSPGAPASPGPTTPGAVESSPPESLHPTVHSPLENLFKPLTAVHAPAAAPRRLARAMAARTRSLEGIDRACSRGRGDGTGGRAIILRITVETGATTV